MAANKALSRLMITVRASIGPNKSVAADEAR